MVVEQEVCRRILGTIFDPTAIRVVLHRGGDSVVPDKYLHVGSGDGCVGPRIVGDGENALLLQLGHDSAHLDDGLGE